MPSVRVSAFVLVSCVSCAASPFPRTRVHELDPTVAALQARALAGSGARETVRSLTDEAGPRLAGSPGDARAVAWALRTMNELGLAHVHAEPVTVHRWTRGESLGEVTAPFPHALALAALGGSVATPAAGLDGEIVRVDSLAALDAIPRAQVEGRIVFIDAVMPRTQSGHGYAETVPGRTSGASHAARKGAIALLVRSVGTDSHRLAHTGALHYEDGVPRIPAAAISIPDADVLARLVARGAPVRVHLALSCHDDGDAPSANVVGEVPGRDAARANEIVLLGAHLDSWDLGTGALDDGAGCGIVLATAHLLATMPDRSTRPSRTVRVVLYANEENGSAGANAYARDHANEAANHVLAMEADAGDGRVFALRVPASGADRAAWSVPLGWLAGLNVTPSWEHAHGGADVGEMVALGVPVADLAQDMSRYFDLHHTADDTFDKIDGASLDQVVASFVTVTWWAAERAVRPIVHAP